MAHSRTTSRDLYAHHPSRSMDIDHEASMSNTRRKSSLGGVAGAAAANWAEDAGHFDASGDAEATFFVPSYLRDSRHADRLRRAHEESRIRAQEQRRRRLQQMQQQQHHTSSGPSGKYTMGRYPSAPSTANSSSVSLPRPPQPAPQQQHRRSSSGVYLPRSSTTTTTSIIQETVIERPPPPPPLDPSQLAPLPTRFSDTDKNPCLDVLAGGTEVRYTGLSKTNDEGATVRADHPMPRAAGIYYFEITILSRASSSSRHSSSHADSSGGSSVIGLGFCTAKASLARMPGWEPDSWAYHADDGALFHNTSTPAAARPYGPRASREDVLGCGVNFRTGAAFFTRNGTSLGPAFPGLALPSAATGPPPLLYPCVGMKRAGESVRANFGRAPFVFDIERVGREERAAVAAAIARVRPEGLRLRAGAVDDDVDDEAAEGEEDAVPQPAGDEGAAAEDEAALLHELVADYLAHEGYVETARAFATDVQAAARAISSPHTVALTGNNDAGVVQTAGSGVTAPLSAAAPHSRRRRHRAAHLVATAAADPHAVERQRIRRRILDGDIDGALAATLEHFPCVIAPPAMAGPAAAAAVAGVAFRLRCRKFVEMTRRYMAMLEAPAIRHAGQMDGEQEGGALAASSPVTVTKSVQTFGSLGRGKTPVVRHEEEDDDRASEEDEEDSEEDDDEEDEDEDEEESSEDGDQDEEDVDDEEEPSTQMELDDQFHRESSRPSTSSAHLRSGGRQHPGTTSRATAGDDIDMTTSQDLSSLRPRRNRRRSSRITTHEPADGRGDAAAGDLLAAMLEYGQELSRDYLRPSTSSEAEVSPAVKKHLADIFSIMPYRRIADSPVAPLFDIAGRVTLAEEVNAMILASLGKPAEAALERLIATTETLLDETARKMGGAAALVNVRRDFLRP